MFVGMFCVCVWANMCDGICYSGDRKKIFFVTKDINKVLNS